MWPTWEGAGTHQQVKSSQSTEGRRVGQSGVHVLLDLTYMGRLLIELVGCTTIQARSRRARTLDWLTLVRSVLSLAVTGWCVLAPATCRPYWRLAPSAWPTKQTEPETDWCEDLEWPLTPFERQLCPQIPFDRAETEFVAQSAEVSLNECLSFQSYYSHATSFLRISSSSVLQYSGANRIIDHIALLSGPFQSAMLGQLIISHRRRTYGIGDQPKMT